jgi:hypothetical protein
MRQVRSGDLRDIRARKTRRATWRDVRGDDPEVAGNANFMNRFSLSAYHPARHGVTDATCLVTRFRSLIDGAPSARVMCGRGVAVLFRCYAYVQAADPTEAAIHRPGPMHADARRRTPCVSKPSSGEACRDGWRILEGGTVLLPLVAPWWGLSTSRVDGCARLSRRRGLGAGVARAGAGRQPAPARDGVCVAT